MNADENTLHNIILQAWDCAFIGTPVVYLSGPLTTGPRQVARMISAKHDDSAKSDAFRENCLVLKEAAATLRRRRSDVIVEPASLNVVGWSQSDYLKLWHALIERHVKLIVFLPGWEYSVGCVSEFERAIRHDIRTEKFSGGGLNLEDGLALVRSAIEHVETLLPTGTEELGALSERLMKACNRLETLRGAPSVKVKRGPVRKDVALDTLAAEMNVAQFVSFAPSKDGPNQEYSRVKGFQPNHRFQSVEGALHQLLAMSADASINVRSYEPHNPQSREFVYGIRNVAEAVATLRRLTEQGLFTIVNETIDVHDGGVSGVLYGDVVEFAPDDTPRCVEKPGTAALPRGWGRELLGTVYACPIALDVPLASRLEFSIHPKPCGWHHSNVLVWEYSEEDYTSTTPSVVWPNRFSQLLGDKVYGLLVAHHIGLPVPQTTVINRRIAPFSFGQPTGLFESWIRTAPNVQVPGRFKTNHGWIDPFKLLEDEDPLGETIPSIVSQMAVKQGHSGALVVGSDGEPILEGKAGEGESYMLGTSMPEELPATVQQDVLELFDYAAASIGPVRFEWVHDGNQAWIVQLHSGSTNARAEYINERPAETWVTFDIERGLEALRKFVDELPVGTGVALSKRVGQSSHFADVIRRADVPGKIAS